MESVAKPFALEADDKYDKRCGEVFLTIKGHIIFHCAFCDDRFNSFPDYTKHVIQLHCKENSYLTDEDNPLDYDDSEETELATYFQETDEIDMQVLIERDGEIDSDITNVQKEKKEREQKLSIFPQCKVIESTERKHKCKICGFAFKRFFNLRAHVRRHFDNKRYECSQCFKAFHTRTEMETHERRHKGERPFICEECGQSFVTAGALTMHVKRHKDIRNHECSQCNKKFFDGYALKLHMVGHTTDRPYECDVCSSTFARRKSLVVHKKIHENKREYQCKYCESSFNQKPGLYSHLKIKHNGYLKEET